MVPILPDALSRWVAGVLVIAMVGAVTGWRIRGRIADGVEARLEVEAAELTERLERSQQSYATAKGNAARLEGALTRQSAEVARLGEAYTAAVARQWEAEQRVAALLARPTPTPPTLIGTCEEMVEQVRQAAMEGW